MANIWAINKNAAKPGNSLLRMLLFLGILVRIVVFFQNRSLFLDEANLALNIAERSFAGFFSPLEYQQYAPPFFLVLEKVSWLVGGPSELSLRFWPLIMGGLSLYLFYLLLNRSAPFTLPNLLVLFLFAFSVVYIRYATEVKQYSTDMAVTLWLVWSALHLNPGTSKRNFMYWLVAGCGAIWLSMPSVFVLAGAGAYFLYERLAGRSKIPGWMLLALAGAWVLQFGLYYHFILSADLQKTGLVAYHQSHFWPLWPDSREEWSRLWSLVQSLSGTLIGHTIWAVVLGLLGIGAGIYFLWKQQTGRVILLLIPVVCCLAASGLGLYSLMERLSLFMMPLLGLLLVAGFYGAWKKAPTGWRIALVVAWLPVLPLRKGMKYLAEPLVNEEIRPLLQSMDPLIAGDELIWIDHNARPAFVWYTSYNQQAFPWKQGIPLINNAWNKTATEEILPEKAGQEVWLVFSHLVSDFNRQEMQVDLDGMANKFGPPVMEMKYPGAAAYKFQLDR